MCPKIEGRYSNDGTLAATTPADMCQGAISRKNRYVGDWLCETTLALNIAGVDQTSFGTIVLRQPDDDTLQVLSGDEAVVLKELRRSKGDFDCKPEGLVRRLNAPVMSFGDETGEESDGLKGLNAFRSAMGLLMASGGVQSLTRTFARAADGSLVMTVRRSTHGLVIGLPYGYDYSTFVTWPAAAAPSSPRVDEATLPAKLAPIVVGQSKRSAVRQALGKPWLTSDYWCFDAFRITEWNTGVIVFGGGIPVPVWGKEDGYILVAYDERGRAAEVQYGLRSYDWSVGEQPATVTVRDLQLLATGKEVFLTVPPDRRDRYLHDVPTGDRCRVLIGAVEGISDVALVVDGRPGPTLPKTMNDTLLVLVLTPASHRIELPGNAPAVANVRCESGSTYYLAVKPSTSYERSFELSLSSEAPNGFADQALLIWGNGQWLVDAEPDQLTPDPVRQ